MKITTKQAKNVRPVTIYSFTFHCYSTELLSIHTEKKKLLYVHPISQPPLLHKIKIIASQHSISY